MIANFRWIAVLISPLVSLAGHWVARWTNDSLPPYLFNNLNLISNYVPVTAWSHVDEWDGKRRRSWIVCNLYLVINMSGVSSIKVFSPPSFFKKKMLQEVALDIPCLNPNLNQTNQKREQKKIRKRGFGNKTRAHRSSKCGSSWVYPLRG